MTAHGAPSAEAGLPALVDTHCHLVLLEERGLLDAALESRAEHGVTQVVTVGLDVDDSDRNRQLAERLPGVWFTVGWHPHQPGPPDSAQVAALRELADHPRCVAVGEIGLDHFWRPGYHETSAERQLEGLRMMLEIAADARLPVVVHDRDAHDEVVAALGAGLRGPGGGRPAGVFHCFSGGPELATAAARLDMVCSFAGIVTFPRSEPVQAAAAAVAEGGWTVETDAPFLAPIPYRGRPNLPGYAAATAAAVARLRGMDIAAARAEAAATGRRLFGLPGT